MRILRGAIIGATALLITTTAMAVSQPAQATAALPSAPYNAFTLDGSTGSHLLHGMLAFDATNATIGATGSATMIRASVNGDGHQWSLWVTPPTGSTFVAGTTYTTLRSGATATNGFGDIGGDGRGCNYQRGSLTIHELTINPDTQQLTSLALSFSVSCENNTPALFTQVRYNSSLPYRVATPTPGFGLTFGDQPVNEPGSERTLTFTGKGPTASVFGAASIVDGNMFTISSDTCSGTTLVAGANCAIVVRANATGYGEQKARLKVPVDNPSGAYYADLILNGMDRQLTPSTSRLDFGVVAPGASSAPLTVTLQNTRVVPLTVGTVAVTEPSGVSFDITGDTCSGAVLEVVQTCRITVVARPSTGGRFAGELAVNYNSNASPVRVSLAVRTEPINKGTYYSITPTRILDTRAGNGAPPVKVGPGATVRLQVADRGGVPASGVSAVVLNVTATEPTGWGYVTVFPSGVAMPTASALNFTPGWTGANSVTVALGTNGQVDLFNSAGNTHLIADVVGYYALDDRLVSARGYGGEFQPAQPERLFDSRSDWGEKLPSGYWVEIPVSYGSVYDPHIRALAVNVTAVDAAWAGYLTGFDGSGQVPVASTLNVSPGAVVSNFAIVPTSTCWDCGPMPVPMIGIYTSTDVHVVVDIVGFYDDGQLADGVHDGLRFAPRTPLRIADSRDGHGIARPLGPGTTVAVAPPASSLPEATDAVALNVTAVSPSADTFVSVWPTGLPWPGISTLNPSRGQIVPNAAVTLLGQGNQFNVYNNGGTVNIIVDMVGTFYYLPAVGLSGPSLAFKQADAGAAPANRARPPSVSLLDPQLRHR